MTNNKTKGFWGTDWVYDPDQQDWVLVPFWIDDDDDSDD